MDDRCETFKTALESGDTDRVNTVIDELNAMDLDERVECFEACFEPVADLYGTADDGYVRQSVVRVAEQLTPGLPAVVALGNEDRSMRAEEADIRAQTDTLCGFFLEALTDTDGRVRQSAQRGLKDVVRTYDALEDEATIDALVAELDEMATQASGTTQTHLAEAKEDVQFFRQSGLARLLEGFQDELGDSLRGDE